jgi:hypothetical protein
MFLAYYVHLVGVKEVIGKARVNNQLGAQLLYSIIRLLQSPTCFEQRRAHHQEVKFYQYSIWFSHSL